MFKNTDFIKTWEETRKSGRLRYALVEGTIFGYIIAATPLAISIFSESVELNIHKYWAYYLGFSILGGIILYWLVFWPLNEYFYKKKKKNNKTKQDI